VGGGGKSEGVLGGKKREFRQRARPREKVPTGPENTMQMSTPTRSILDDCVYSREENRCQRVGGTKKRGIQNSKNKYIKEGVLYPGKEGWVSLSPGCLQF